MQRLRRMEERVVLLTGGEGGIAGAPTVIDIFRPYLNFL